MNRPPPAQRTRELKNVFGATFITIRADNASRFVHNHWRGMLSVDNVKQGATECLNMLRDTGYTQLLNDNTDIIGSWDEANDWIAETWMPQALALGLRQFAHILPPSIFGVTAAEQMRVRVGDKFEMRLFKSLPEGKAWLAETR